MVSPYTLQFDDQRYACLYVPVSTTLTGERVPAGPPGQIMVAHSPNSIEARGRLCSLVKVSHRVRRSGHLGARRGPSAPPSAARLRVPGVAFLLAQLGFHSSSLWKDRLAPLGMDPRHVVLLRHVAAAEGRSPAGAREGHADPRESHGRARRRARTAWRARAVTQPRRPVGPCPGSHR